MLQKLVETFTYDINSISNISLTESEQQKFTEVGGKSYKNLRKFRVPISRFTENKNGRIYPRKLWENVIKNQRHIWEGSVGLAGHAEDDGEFDKVMCVWSNLHINEKEDVVCADVVFVGELGEKALQVIDAQGKIGFSTSGWGELLEDKKTVCPETYMLERVADVVLTPSQDVWGTAKNEITTEENQSPSSNHAFVSENTNNSIDEEILIDKKEKLMENTKTVKISKLEEKRIFKDVMSFLENAEKIENPIEKLSELTEIKESLDSESFPELVTLLEKAITKTKEEINTKLTHATELEKTFETTDPEKFKEGLSKLATHALINEEKVDEWKKVNNKLKEIIIKLQGELNSRPEPEDLQKTLEEVEALKNKIKEMRIYYADKAKDFSEAIKTLQEKYNRLEQFSAGMREQNALLVKNLKKTKEIYHKKLEEKNAKLKQYKEKFIQLKEQYAKEKARVEVQTDFRDVTLAGHTNNFSAFKEREEIKNYFKDMYKQYGEEILPIKEQILACKTLKEASRLVFSYFTEKEQYPVYEGGDAFEARKFTENTTGLSIKKSKSISLPKGWE